MSHIAILSTCVDLHGHLLHEVLHRKGHHAVWFDGPDYPTRLEITLESVAGNCIVGYSSGPSGITADDFTSVWVRRAVDLSHYPDWYSQLDPGEAQKGKQEADALRRNFLAMLGPSALWVNPWSAKVRAENKAAQLHCAARCGFRVPHTLMSNSPERIRAFVSKHEGSVIYKGFRPTGIPTSRILASHLPENDDLLRVVPGIFQVLVEKAYELRVTVVGQRLFAFRIESQSTIRGKLDWRSAYNEIEVAAVDLPPEVESMCLGVCRQFGLAYGAIDLIVTPTGEYVFLEINESGQFVFLEDMATVQGNRTYPLLDAVSELLIQGRADFSWSPNSAHHWGSDDDVFEAAVKRKELAVPLHNLPPGTGELPSDRVVRANFNEFLAHRRQAREAEARV